MPVELKYPHIEKVNGEPARLERVPRVRVAQMVMDHLSHGWSADEICRQYPHLTPAEVHSALAYYYDHRDEIEREIERDWKMAEESATQSARPPFLVRLLSKRKS